MDRADASGGANGLSVGITAVEEISHRIFDYRDRLESRRDSRAVFAHAYGRMTAAIATRLARPDSFEDPDWIVALVLAFSARFFAAQDAIDGNGAIPPGWRDVSAELLRGRTSIYEDLLLGMSAHIIYDLPHALVDTEFIGPGVRPSHLGDYHRMNDVLGDAIDEIQDEVAKRYNTALHFFDQLAGRHDELLTDYGMRLWRGMAWYNAMRLMETPADAERSIAESPGALMQELLHPPGFDAVLRAMRWISTWFRRWPSPAR